MPRMIDMKTGRAVKFWRPPQAGGGGGGEVTYGVTSWDSPGAVYSTDLRVGWVFDPTEDIVLDRLRHFGSGEDPADYRVMLHRLSDDEVMASADITKVADAWAEKTVAPVVLIKGERYTLSAAIVSGDAGTASVYRNATNPSTPSEIEVHDDGVYATNGDTRPSVGTENQYFPPADFGFTRDFSGYVVYRLLIEANNGDSFYGLGELELYEVVDGPNVISAIDGPVAADTDDGVNPPANAFDDDDTTGWRSENNPPLPQWVKKYIARADEPANIAQYGVRAWTTSFSPAERSPKDWRLQRSYDGGKTWEDLDVVTGESGWTEAELRKFTI